MRKFLLRVLEQACNKFTWIDQLIRSFLTAVDTIVIRVNFTVQDNPVQSM